MISIHHGWMVAAAVLMATHAGTAFAAEPHCVAAAVHGSAGAGAAPGQDATSARACLFDTGAKTPSPSIQATRQGVVFIAKSSQGLLRSDDGGRNWVDVKVPAHANGDSHGFAIHGYVHVDPVTDRVYYVTSGGAKSCGLGKGAVVSWSDDQGRTWAGNTVGCDTFDWGRLVTGVGPAGGSQRAIYFFGMAPRFVGGLRKVYRSLDDGKTWQRTKNVASVTTEAGAGVTAPDGTIYFDYPEFTGFYPDRKQDTTYPYKPENKCRQMIAVSEDFGDTWRQEPIPDSLGCNMLYGQQRVAVDAAGTVYALWSDDRDGQVYMVVSKNKARSWSARIKVMPPGTTFNSLHANIVAGKEGHIVIAALNTSAPENPRRGVIQGKGEWRAYMTESFNANAASPSFQSFNLDPEDDPSLRSGENPTEAEAYLGMTPGGTKTWAVFARHGGWPLGGGARISAASNAD